jgi:poly-D-alanine transfer protein DltD
MKQFVLVYVLPLIAAIAITLNLALSNPANHFFFEDKSPQKSINADFRYLENFYDEPLYENQFLNSDSQAATIYLLGSSELTHNSNAIPYNFISDHFKVKVKAIGHAGNQCLSIFSQLLANQQKLDNAPIAIVLSPGWFESKTSKGSPSDVFLEYNSYRFLNKIITSNDADEFNAYLNNRIAALFEEFNSPNLELRLMNYRHQSSLSFLHKSLYTPVITADEELLKLRNKIHPIPQNNHPFHARISIAQENFFINWDSLYSNSKEQVINNASGNKLGIANNYYPAFKNKKGRIQPVSNEHNQELNDMLVLIKFLKEKHANASFIISPLNPFYYKNLKDLSPTIAIIEQAIKTNGFKYLNMFEPDTNKYDKALLSDVMHLSPYGWYKIDHFIIDNYHLGL